jgi:hypothetical protein
MYCRVSAADVVTCQQSDGNKSSINRYRGTSDFLTSASAGPLLTYCRLLQYFDAMACKLVSATTRSFASEQCWRFERLAFKSYIVASWSVCQKSSLFAMTLSAGTPFAATVPCAVKALIATEYTGGQVMTKWPLISPNTLKRSTAVGI